MTLKMKLTMGNYMVTGDFFVVNVPDTNVVLGVQWLYSIGCHTTNYRAMEMELIGLDGKKVVLRGMHSYPPQFVTTNRMEADLRKGDISWVVKCRILEIGTRARAQQHHPDILTVLQRHQTVFGEILLGHPPVRGFKHIIELEEGV